MKSARRCLSALQPMPIESTVGSILLRKTSNSSMSFHSNRDLIIMTTAKKKPARAAKATRPAAKSTWSNTIKKALEKKRQPSGWPEQPKPRDSVVQKVKKNAF